ncbi:glycoside hydrolase superfamily [Penicillium canariense]|uniref:beta-glucosidase n=1 Tax=Penicillium canariense TaxID=189055 RepID=A0A9W9LE85_9EURO|nr:glycoside hydrolase superfamily [Penicillium canariense]KAJ5150920.1 glycoside hydrolase superfamily [Penicillium canariense]
MRVTTQLAQSGLPPPSPHTDSQPTSFTFLQATDAVKSGLPLPQVVARLLSELTKTECLSLLDGDEQFWGGLRTILCDRYNRHPFVHGHVRRLGIPGIRFTDGPRGVVMGESTAFPVSMARGATWDVDLERRVGEAIGREAKAQGANFFAGVCVNLPRHPAWGRSQETYGEDPLLLGEFGLALTQGVQQHVMACVKHFALNSMENARFQVDVQVDEDVLREVYLPHFRRIVDGGAAAVMSAYNSVNGEWAGQSHQLLMDILRGEWGFDGFVMSDFIFGLRDAATSVRNGLDIEAPFRQQRAMDLPAALASGELDWSDVHRACARILTKQLEFAIRTESSQPDPAVVFCEEHRALSREVATRGTVLLKNEEVGGQRMLPLHASSISQIAVVGRLATVPNTGDKGSSQVFAPHVVTALEGIRCAFPQAQISFTHEPGQVTEMASQADVVICVVGYDHQDEGEYVVPALKENPTLQGVLPPAVTPADREMLAVIKGDSADQSASAIEVGAGGDRASLRLRAEDVALIEAVSHNPRTVVSVVAGGTVIMEEWRAKVPAILMSWYSGCEGGHALADLLVGRVEPSGRLPVSIPTNESHLPFFDVNATRITYDRWYGQHLLDRMGVPAAFPFGYGLSYTSFAVDNLRVIPAQSATDADGQIERLTVHFDVRNTGSRAGRYQAQVYGRPGVENFPSCVLLGFAPVSLALGETRAATITVSLRPLQRFVDGKLTLPRKKILVEVASFAGDPDATRIAFML